MWRVCPIFSPSFVDLTLLLTKCWIYQLLRNIQVVLTNENWIDKRACITRAMWAILLADCQQPRMSKNLSKSNTLWGSKMLIRELWHRTIDCWKHSHDKTPKAIKMPASKLTDFGIKRRGRFSDEIMIRHTIWTNQIHCDCPKCWYESCDSLP